MKLKVIYIIAPLFIAILMLTNSPVNAQAVSQKKSIHLNKDTIQLDSLSIIKSSFSIKDNNGQPIDSNFYLLDPLYGLLILPKNSPIKNQSIEVNYKTYPFSFTKTYSNKSPNLIQNQQVISSNPFKYKVVPKTTSEFMELGGIQKSGSISRGIGFGNNRDLSVSSSMNLQFSGKITSNLNIMAAVSDENIPIQPEGNTQQLQDFDQVYIKVYNDQASLIAGDFKITAANSYFMKYNKKAQGISGEVQFDLNQKAQSESKGKMAVQLSGALSRGKFSRNVIQGVEGNQGPYRLSGAENESFIIILSGTERVYIDGKLLTRGQSNDYVINYNTAEISFTAKQLITKDKRIIVEFQYSDQNYTRTLFQVRDHYQYKNLDLTFNFYSEQDAKNQSLQQDLSNEQKQILADAGDSLQNAFSSGARKTEFTENEVLYKMIDTLGYDSVFVFSNQPDSAQWRVVFTKVGPGNGDYILLNTITNGRVYSWVPPQGGVRQGEYAPIVVLFSPKQRQMITLAGKYKLSAFSEIQLEGALSNNDVNTFSTKDQQDDIGLALKANWKHGIPLSKKENGWMISPNIGLEHWGDNFVEIERIRTVEFYRDWNLRNTTLTSEQNIYNAGVELKQEKKTNITYQLQGFSAASEYNAQKQSLVTNLNYDQFSAQADISLLNSKSSLINTQFIRHRSLIKKKIKRVQIGYKDDREDNQIIDNNGDTLSNAAYRFWEREYFLESADSSSNYYRIFFTQREDFKARENQLKQATFGENYGGEFKWKSFRPFTFGIKTVYRKLSIQDDQLTTQKPDENLLSRLEYQLRLWKGALTTSSFYEVGSGLEAKREYKYLEVPAGQGAYTWIDINNNGIQEIDEFEIAKFNDEARYIRIFTISNDYVKVFTNQFNQSVYLNPGKVWSTQKGIRKLVAAFSNQTAYRMNRKTQNSDLNSRFNPIQVEQTDTQLVNLNTSIRNTVYFNRAHQIFGLDYTVQDIRGKTLLSSGIESRSNFFQIYRGRWNITRTFLLESEYKRGLKESDASFTNTRDYSIDYYSIQPKLTFQPGVSFRISLLYEYLEKANVPDFGGQQTIHQKASILSRFQKVGKGSVLLEVSYISINLNGTVDGTLGYEMLDGLQPGDNGTWQATYQRNIGKYLQLNVSYNGRSSEGNKAIHSGNVRMRAYF